MIPNFNTYLRESHWSEMNRRSQGIAVRNEDKIPSNIGSIKPVDLGVSVLWADRDLELNDNNMLKLKDVEKYLANSKWRLPTKEEAEELFPLFVKYESSYTTFNFRNEETGEAIHFEKSGQIYIDFNNAETITTPNVYVCWTSTEKDPALYVNYCLKVSLHSVKIEFYGSRNRKMRIRLVRDK